MIKITFQIEDLSNGNKGNGEIIITDDQFNLLDNFLTESGIEYNKEQDN